MNHKLIHELQPGDSVLSFYIVRKKEVKEQRRNRELYITFDLGDPSGRIRGSVWDNIDEVNSAIHVHDIVRVKGKVISYHDSPHISIERIRKTTADDNVDPAQFLPTNDLNVEALFEQMLQYIQGVENKYLHQLLMLIFGNPKFAEQFRNGTAAKLWHHNYVGGLLEHTLSLVHICDTLASHYQLNRDLAVTAALLHDIGKLSELSADGYFEYTTQGRLLGHITMGAQYIQAKITQVKDFPNSLRLHLLHCILSHHGSHEHGSPVVPMTREAMILHYADELDSKIGAFDRIMKKEAEPGKEWSNYVNLLDRFLFIGGVE
ncbi:HD domain-containing protein [candidate division KSB1 bacterium]|nr:HD domain-containing protein [candidate division KSB1 bacterium]